LRAVRADDFRQYAVSFRPRVSVAFFGCTQMQAVFRPQALFSSPWHGDDGLTLAFFCCVAELVED